MTKPTRNIVTLVRGADGLFVQPNDTGAAREMVENHNRERFANHCNFADPYTGNTRTFDPDGNYICGSCNQDNKAFCLMVYIGKPAQHQPLPVDEEAGSCEDYENQCAGDPEMTLNVKSVESANYGVAKNGKGFGCHRCPFAEKAHEPDSMGRNMYCGKGDFRTFWNACCNIKPYSPRASGSC